MATRRFFGTDGIRGKVGEEPITPDFVLKLGWATGRVLGSRDGEAGKILIGKDTRVSGYMLESALESGLSAAGIDIRFLGPMPTPAIAYLTRTSRARAGIVISASHNPFDDNGIKFFPPRAASCRMRWRRRSRKRCRSPCARLRMPGLARRAAIRTPAAVTSSSARAPFRTA